jgi:hypothetical protein
MFAYHYMMPMPMPMRPRPIYKINRPPMAGKYSKTAPSVAPAIQKMVM